MSKLTAIAVHDIFIDCLFREGEDMSAAIIAEGIINKFGFHPDRLASNKEKIIELLNELHHDFHQNIGGGMSFLNACVDKYGNHWGEHRDMDKLFVLGMAVGYAKSLIPKSLWNAMSGGMPYYSIG